MLLLDHRVRLQVLTASIAGFASYSPKEQLSIFQARNLLKAACSGYKHGFNHKSWPISSFVFSFEHGYFVTKSSIWLVRAVQRATDAVTPEPAYRCMLHGACGPVCADLALLNSAVHGPYISEKVCACTYQYWRVSWRSGMWWYVLSQNCVPLQGCIGQSGIQDRDWAVQFLRGFPATKIGFLHLQGYWPYVCLFDAWKMPWECWQLIFLSGISSRCLYGGVVVHKARYICKFQFTVCRVLNIFFSPFSL